MPSPSSGFLAFHLSSSLALRTVPSSTPFGSLPLGGEERARKGVNRKKIPRIIILRKGGHQSQENSEEHHSSATSHPWMGGHARTSTSRNFHEIQKRASFRRYNLIGNNRRFSVVVFLSLGGHARASTARNFR